MPRFRLCTWVARVLASCVNTWLSLVRLASFMSNLFTVLRLVVICRDRDNVLFISCSFYSDNSSVSASLLETTPCMAGTMNVERFRLLYILPIRLWVLLLRHALILWQKLVVTLLFIQTPIRVLGQLVGEADPRKPLTVATNGCTVRTGLPVSVCKFLIRTPQRLHLLTVTLAMVLWLVRLGSSRVLRDSCRNVRSLLQVSMSSRLMAVRRRVSLMLYRSSCSFLCRCEAWLRDNGGYRHRRNFRMT